MKLFTSIPKKVFVVTEEQVREYLVEDRKEQQLQVVQKFNPADDEHFVSSTWIRSVDDILSFDEMLQQAKADHEEYGDMMYPDTTMEDYLEAEKTGSIRVYSSYPIEPGIFVSPSRMCATDYAGGGKVYMKVVPVDDVAWLDQSEGQYAPVEALRSNINEAMDDAFSFEELSRLSSFTKRLKYCTVHLGKPIGSGTARSVFQLSDEKVLKLAKNPKGIAQNETEADGYAQTYDVLPNLYETADDNSWIVMEYVLPAKDADFRHCLGMSFKTFCEWVKKAFLAYSSNADSRFITSDMSDEEFEKSLDNEWFSYYYSYLADYDVPLGDLLRISSYGICQRNGGVEIVLLDSGLSQDVFDNYYKRW